ncbi:MAG TPA: universal stress protein [Bacteroidales bacterium]|nr:universal stress protein [Bacteroidales bacterium]
MNYKRILIAIDDRDNSTNVAKTGFELAEQLKAEVAIVYAVDLSKVIRNYDMINPELGLFIKDSIVESKESANKAIDSLVHKFNRDKKITRFTPEGSPREVILEVSDDWKADLIVIGLHGKSGIGIFFMGSISQYISLHSTVPVLIVPQIEETKE